VSAQWRLDQGWITLFCGRARGWLVQDHVYLARRGFAGGLGEAGEEFGRVRVVRDGLLGFVKVGYRYVSND
jgi:hypothetical protein